VLDSHDFTVEMETGTGKTYVYLRTMLELNKRYGMSKFIIVVPSVAIKEGVYKTLQITEEHFKSLYAGVPYEYYLYDSAKPADVRNFATSSVMQIMVMTVGAINKKDVNKLYQSSEKTTVDDLDKPIDLIRATRPIIIVDEPQSVDGGLNGAGKTALDAMHPCSPYAIQQHMCINIIWCIASMPLMLTIKNWSNRSKLPGLKSRMQATALM
jgi:type III restriction enzyme